MIASAVQALVDRGFHATRNKRLPMDTPSARASAEGGSACDAVGVAFDMSYPAVQKVWTDSKPSAEEPPAEEPPARETLRPTLDLLFSLHDKQRTSRTPLQGLCGTLWLWMAHNNS